MKRGVLWLGIGVAAVLVGVVVWFYASTGVSDDVEVSAPELETPETTEGSESAPPAEEASGDLYELGDGSMVTFELDEELRGSPVHVVATNPEVAAQIRFDPADLSTVEIGTVVISSETFETGSGNRDRAIRGPILDSGAVPTIEFVPTSIDGLEGQAEAGDSFEFTITGDLTVRDITNEVTFDAEATYGADRSVTGSASTTVLRSEYELSIPNAPGVANVTDEVLITIDFVATPAR